MFRLCLLFCFTFRRKVFFLLRIMYLFRNICLQESYKETKWYTVLPKVCWIKAVPCDFYTTVVLKLEHLSESPARLVETGCWPCSQFLTWWVQGGAQIFASLTSPQVADAAGPDRTRKSLLWSTIWVFHFVDHFSKTRRNRMLLVM